MAAIKTVADSQGWFYLLTTIPADLSAITLTDLTEGPTCIKGSFIAAANGTRFAFAASDTVSDPAYGDSSNGQVRGRANYEGSIAPFVHIDDTTGLYDEDDNPLIAVLAGLVETGVPFAIISGVTGSPDDARVAGDLYDAFTYTADYSNTPTEVGGYQKRNFPLLPNGKSAHMQPLLAAPAGP